MKTSLRCFLLLTSVTPATSWHVPTTLHQKAIHALQQTKKACQTAFATAALTTCLVLPPASPLTHVNPANAAPSLNDAILEVSQSSYPIIKALDPTNFQAFSVKIADLIFTSVTQDKLAKSLELAIDVFDSVPPAELETFNKVLKEGYLELKTDSCTLVPLPPISILDRVSTLAVEKIPAEKLKTFGETWNPSIALLSKTDAAICLPNVDTLDKLSLAQADLGRSFSPVQSKAFTQYTVPALKNSISISKLFPLINDAKKLTPTATAGEKAAFQRAGKTIETASKSEALKSKQAAVAAKTSSTMNRSPGAEAYQGGAAAEARKEALAQAAAGRASEIAARNAALEEKQAEARSVAVAAQEARNFETASRAKAIEEKRVVDTEAARVLAEGRKIEAAQKVAEKEEKRVADLAVAKQKADPAYILAEKEKANRVAEEERAAKAAKLEATIAANKAAKEAQLK